MVKNKPKLLQRRGKIPLPVPVTGKLSLVELNGTQLKFSKGSTHQYMIASYVSVMRRSLVPKGKTPIFRKRRDVVNKQHLLRVSKFFYLDALSRKVRI